MVAMPAPDHSAIELQHLGYSIIPLAPQDKRPYLRILPGGWSEYQRRAASDVQVQQWINVGDARMGWGLICGKVSGGAYCDDADDLDLAHWILAHAQDPVLRGACVVESGSGKAHVWFRSQTPIRSGVWSLGQGRKAGDIRGEGSGGAGPSYMVVPPSLHPDTGRPYRIRAGSFAALPLLPDGNELARSIVEAYLADGGGTAATDAPVDSPSYRILVLNDAQIATVVSRVRGLQLRGKVRDALLKPGFGAPGHANWSMSTDPSGSGIDFFIVCELLRRNQTLEEVEEIFAASPIGDNCYRQKGRGSYGHAYLKRTYDKAAEAIRQEQAAAQRATGANFTVMEVARRYRGEIAEYALRITVVQPGRPDTLSTVTIDSVQLGTEKGFRDACFKPSAGMWIPEFLPGQRGQNWGNFMRAVNDMASETQQVPVEYTDEGALARRLERLISPAHVEDEMPTRFAYATSFGWQFDGAFYLFPEIILARTQSMDRRVDSARLHRILGILGAVEHFTYAGWVDHSPTPLYRLTPRGSSV